MPLYYKQNTSWKEFNPNPYPIGTLYYATKDVSPASLVGGIWKKLDVSSKEELTGIVAESVASNIGKLTDFAFYHDGSEVTGTLTWRNNTGNSYGVYVLSGLPTIASASQVVGTFSYSDACKIVLTREGKILLEGTEILPTYTSYTASVSYTTNQMLGGGGFRLRANRLAHLKAVA